jgi:hypothetical protein
VKILFFFASQPFNEFLPFIKWHCLHLSFNQGYPASFGLAFLIQRVFFCIEVNEVGFSSGSSFPLAFGTIFGIMSFFATREAIECSLSTHVGYIGSSSPLAPGISLSSCSSIISRFCSSQVHEYCGIVHWWWGVWQVILPWWVVWRGSIVVVWPLVLKWHKGGVLSGGSLRCQFPLGHCTVGSPFFDGIVSADCECPHNIG